jgi:uncharacterized protein YceH (UPF0502 family)
MPNLLSPVRHHLARIAKKAGAGWDPDCDTELIAELEALEARLQDMESRLLELEKTLDSHGIYPSR